MISTDEEALICDMAETYGIFDIWSLPVKTLATLAAGLRDDARIKLIMNGLQLPINTMLSALIADRLAVLVWQQTIDGVKNINQPKSILDIILGREETENKDIMTFSSGREFEEAWKGGGEWQQN